MRKLNSNFKTNFISEAGSFLQNKDYFAFVELDDYACYVIADGIDDDTEYYSSKLAVTSVIRNFTEKPSMSKRTLKKLLELANNELISRSTNLRLKASVIIILTDYSKIMYALAGNTRLYLFREGFLRYKSEDQSLTQLMVKREEVPVDRMAEHIERNNLYCYLGQPELSDPYISKKVKLIDGDILMLLTKGIWENVDEHEIGDAVEEAKGSKELVDDIEELLLSKQRKQLENYTLACTFIDKVYVYPDRKKQIKKYLLIALPIIIIIIILCVVLKIKSDKKNDSLSEMKNHKVSAEQYIENGNMTKASEEYKLALEIANKYKVKDDQKDLDKHFKFIQLILDGDEKLKGNKYQEAIDKYMLAMDNSYSLDNNSSKYIVSKLIIARNCIRVTDLISLGDKSLEVGNVDDAEKNYKQAKELATEYSLKDEKKEAMDKLEKIYAQKADDAKKAKDDEEKEKKDAEQKQKDQENDESKAVEFVKKGDVAYESGDYSTAKMYYIMAKDIYRKNQSSALADELEKKIQLMDRKIGESSNKKALADGYVADADSKVLKGDISAAKVIYLLAKDIYDKAGLTEDSKKVQAKIDALK